MVGRSTTRLRFSKSCRRRACSTPISSRACSIHSDLELGETIKLIFRSGRAQQAAAHRPRLAVGDRLLALDSLRYRRQILAMKHYFARFGATVLMLDDLTTDILDKTVHSVAHGVIRPEEMTPDYGGERRRLRVVKYRAQGFRGGYHDFVIRAGGARVFPPGGGRAPARLHPRSHLEPACPAFDGLLGGGIEQGSSTLLLGPAGSGQDDAGSAVRGGGRSQGRQGGNVPLRRGAGSAVRSRQAAGLRFAAMQATGRLQITQLDAAELSPGEFAYNVRKAADDPLMKTVVIDSLNGYQGVDAARELADPAHA